jgi:hypothetical protein
MPGANAKGELNLHDASGGKKPESREIPMTTTPAFVLSELDRAHHISSSVRFRIIDLVVSSTLMSMRHVHAHLCSSLPFAVAVRHRRLALASARCSRASIISYPMGVTQTDSSVLDRVQAIIMATKLAAGSSACRRDRSVHRLIQSAQPQSRR